MFHICFDVDPITDDFIKNFQVVVSEVPEIILRCISRDEAALAVAQKAFKALYENASSSLHVSANLAILVAIRDVCKRVVKELTSWVCQRPFQNLSIHIVSVVHTLGRALVQLLLIFLLNKPLFRDMTHQ